MKERGLLVRRMIKMWGNGGTQRAAGRKTKNKVIDLDLRLQLEDEHDVVASGILVRVVIQEKGIGRP
jgi:hypothetical protein